MGMDTFRYEPQERQPLPLTYWRRRFLALVTGLAVLALVAWAFSGALGASGDVWPAGRAGPASHGHGPRGYGTGRATGPVGAAAGASRSGGGSSSGSGGGSRPGAVPPAARAPAPAPSSVRPASPGAARAAGSASPGPPRACPAGDVVLSLSSSQDSYGRGQMPEFDVDVVSTSARTCAFNVGPRFLTLVITAGGKRIWSSADCVARPGSLLTDLARGVPTVLPLSWDRATSTPGCRATSRQAVVGSFAAAASDGSLASNSVTFKLS